MDADQANKVVLTNIFKKRGGAGINTRIFADFDRETQARFLARIPLNSGEEPVWACEISLEKWFLVTSRRLIWDLKGVVKASDLTSIFAAKPIEWGIKEKSKWSRIEL